MTKPPNIVDQANGVDMHCHVDLYESPRALLESAERARIVTVAVTNAPSVYLFTEGLAQLSAFVVPALGFHPELVESHGHELQLFEQLFPRTRFIGEIGLDYCSPDRGTRQRQRRLFEAIITMCALQRDKVLTIHSRRAVSDVIAVVGHAFPGTAILHWFSGTSKQLRDAVSAGFWFSVNSAMVLSANGVRLIAEMPRERVLTETDGPFVMVGEEPAKPEDTQIVLRYLANLWRLPVPETTQVILNNFQRATQSASLPSKSLP